MFSVIVRNLISTSYIRAYSLGLSVVVTSLRRLLRSLVLHLSCPWILPHSKWFNGSWWYRGCVETSVKNMSGFDHGVVLTVVPPSEVNTEWSGKKSWFCQIGQTAHVLNSGVVQWYTSTSTMFIFCQHNSGPQLAKLWWVGRWNLGQCISDSWLDHTTGP
jgi:hypothetical protein